MLPSLKPGWWLLCRRACPRVGQIVVAQVDGREVIKRIHSTTETKLVLVGDNQDRTTSYQVEKPQLKGKLVLCLWPPKRVK